MRTPPRKKTVRLHHSRGFSTEKRATSSPHDQSLCSPPRPTYWIFIVWSFMRSPYQSSPSSQAETWWLFCESVFSARRRARGRNIRARRRRRNMKIHTEGENVLDNEFSWFEILAKNKAFWFFASLVFRLQSKIVYRKFVSLFLNELRRDQ